MGHEERRVTLVGGVEGRLKGGRMGGALSKKIAYEDSREKMLPPAAGEGRCHFLLA